MTQKDVDFAKAEGDYSEDPDFHAAIVGVELEKKLGKAGHYLDLRSREVIDDGLDEILLLNIDDKKDRTRFKKLQLAMQAARYANTWIIEGIEEGEMARRRIQQEDEGHQY